MKRSLQETWNHRLHQFAPDQVSPPPDSDARLEESWFASGQCKLQGIVSALFPILIILLLSSAHGAEANAWEIWDDCRLETNRKYFDGDSFHVRHGSESVILRLYFVDAPEINSGYGGQIAEQATYFHVGNAQVLTAGRTAKEFTEQFLAKPFRVITRRQAAAGASRSQRYYAIVESNGRRLDAALIEAGLARARGEIADYPDASAGQKMMQNLHLEEQNAKDTRQGVWSNSAGRVEQLTEKVGNAVKARVGNFVDQTVEKVARKFGSNKETDSRINLNKATAAELQALPGVGPKTADLIIHARPLKNIEDLLAVQGIGRKKIEALRNLVRFE